MASQGRTRPYGLKDLGFRIQKRKPVSIGSRRVCKVVKHFVHGWGWHNGAEMCFTLTNKAEHVPESNQFFILMAILFLPVCCNGASNGSKVICVM